MRKAVKASRQFSRHKKRWRSQRRTACFSGGLPREPANETDNVFERKKALKRSVANRPPASIVGKLLTFAAFAKMFENNLWQPTKLTAKAKLNKD